MSEITRYHLEYSVGPTRYALEFVPNAEGEWVQAEDYLALQQAHAGAVETIAELQELFTYAQQGRRVAINRADEAERERDAEIARVVRLTERLGEAMLRAERMERVVAAAEDVVSFQGTQNEARHFDTLVNALTEYRLGRTAPALGDA